MTVPLPVTVIRPERTAETSVAPARARSVRRSATPAGAEKCKRPDQQCGGRSANGQPSGRQAQRQMSRTLPGLREDLMLRRIPTSLGVHARRSYERGGSGGRRGGTGGGRCSGGAAAGRDSRASMAHPKAGSSCWFVLAVKPSGRRRDHLDVRVDAAGLRPPSRNRRARWRSPRHAHRPPSTSSCRGYVHAYHVDPGARAHHRAKTEDLDGGGDDVAVRARVRRSVSATTGPRRASSG